MVKRVEVAQGGVHSDACIGAGGQEREDEAMCLKRRHSSAHACALGLLPVSGPSPLHALLYGWLSNKEKENVPMAAPMHLCVVCQVLTIFPDHCLSMYLSGCPGTVVIKHAFVQAMCHCKIQQ